MNLLCCAVAQANPLTTANPRPRVASTGSLTLTVAPLPSRAGVAWFTDRAGRRHVRVRADRVRAPKSPFGRKPAEAFPGTFDDSPLSAFVGAVYPDTRTPETLLKKHENGRKAERWPALKVSLYKAIEAEPLEPSHRAALADWYAEAGDEPLAAIVRKGLDVVAGL